MKRTLLLSGLLLTTGVATAQKAFIFNTLQKNGFLSVSTGVSQPVGDFARKTAEAGSGMALRGQSTSLSGGYRIAGLMGLMARYEQTSHAIEPGAMLTQFSRSPGDQLAVSAAAGRAGQWQSRSIMAGPYVTIPLGRLAVDVRMLGGQIWATCPGTCVEGTLQQQETMIRIDTKESTAIMGDLGLTVRYRLTPAVGLHLSGDYSAASFTFANVPLEATIEGQSRQTTITSRKSLAMLNASMGLTVQFRARNHVF